VSEEYDHCESHVIKVLEHTLITELERRLAKGSADISVEEETTLHNTIPTSRPIQALKQHNTRQPEC
jgi:hypothetical protein